MFADASWSEANLQLLGVRWEYDAHSLLLPLLQAGQGERHMILISALPKGEDNKLVFCLSFAGQAKSLQ